MQEPARAPTQSELPYSRDRSLNGSRGVGYWAFCLHRASGLVLSLYLLAHLGFLSALYRGPEAYNAFVAIVSQRSMLVMDVLLVAAAIFHAFNGVRISAVGFGLGVQRQALWFWVAFVLGLAALAAFTVRMLGGG
ncbi:MAG: succinate dehydrogenase, cytochrome b556 subunit [Bacillota bacterium]